MKGYKFLIVANPATEGSSEGMVMVMVSQHIHHEEHIGSIDTASKRVQELKQELINNRQFDSRCGFSISAIANRYERKPNGYDKRKRELSTNYIAA